MDGKKDVSPEVNVKRVKASIIYRLMLIGFGIPMLGFSFICGLMGVFGYDMVKWNNQTIHGLLALPTALLSGILLSLLFTVFLGSVTCLGLWIYSRFRPLQVKVLD
ncbi:hypothetical protein C3432_21410 [Citrobacter amalonaticus]|uniref:Uncharacterized protein n=2 Tax=Citrobacter amalonaticus TaxID=35703 RepID=A0A2S4RVC0_CITAM|nr:hypothetical protein C3432_21410 [Citrobacter amalonaticus]POT73814.1 hypothetical protein C3436_18875 [Citrobacter amalonaticus]POU64039.1 hypothetical protein C3430_17810 [Citrobacter amalonaticus]POV03783.1 hypothetical protein C3424_20725 [Citrobacter amalonaticus]